MSAQLWRGLCLCTGLVLGSSETRAFDRFRHLWEADFDGLPQETSSESSKLSLQSVPRSDRWEIFYRWKSLETLIRNSTLNLKRAGPCAPVMSELILLLAQIQTHVASYRADCLPEHPLTLTCAMEPQRLSEAEKSIFDSMNSSEDCRVTSLSLERSLEALHRPNPMPGVLLSLEGGLRSRKSFDPSGANPRKDSFIESQVLAAIEQRNYEIFDGMALGASVHAGAGLVDSHFAPTWNTALSAGVGNEDSETEFVLSSSRQVGAFTTETPQLVSSILYGASLGSCFAVGGARRSLGFTYNFESEKSTAQIYDALRYRVSLAWLFENGVRSKSQLAMNYEKSLASEFALMPSWQDIGLAWRLSSTLSGGGQGEASLGLDERRDGSGLVRIFPLVELALRSVELPGFQPLGAAEPESSSRISGALTTRLASEPTRWSSMSLIFSVTPQVDWVKEKLKISLSAPLRVFQHQATLPATSRRGLSNAWAAETSYTLSSSSRIWLRTRYERRVLASGVSAPDSRLWIADDLSGREFQAQMGVSYGF